MPTPLPPVFSVSGRAKGSLELASASGDLAHVFVLEDDIIRILLQPKGVLRQPKTWAIAPGAENVPQEGRNRFDTDGFSLPDFSLDESDGKLVVSTSRLRLTIVLKGFFCTWESLVDGDWKEMAADRQTQAYNFGWWNDEVHHYLKCYPGEMFFGLGERAGDANRAGGSYRMKNIDAMGHSAKSTDPLYKHIPFYIAWNPSEKAPLGFFYDTLAECVFDMGREIDGYHRPYRHFSAEAGDLDYYVIAGDEPADITKRFTWLTGRPAFMPKWSLGYSGSTMTYTDAPNAQERMNEFLDGCETHDIPCDSFHLSSGYTSIGNTRYVFNWNRDKFPDPKAFVTHYAEHGVQLVPNIKPCLMLGHPLYEEAEKAGLFVHEADGTPAMVQYWDELGTYLDFTNPKTIDWWKDHVKTALLELGIRSTWNDNNEFEIWSKDAQINGFGAGGRAWDARPLQTMLMIRTSQEAQKEFRPDERPYLVSRAGVTGMQRYAQTWSGDNFTSWETLKYDVRVGTGLAMSGVSNTGHDIGGFWGPKPDVELFLRWVQFGIFLPRFSIHSWNEDLSVNEPWMYPEITPAIRALIKFRSRLVPYFYDLLWRSHSEYEPMMRPTYYDFPEDPKCFEENDDMMLGADLLVAAVVEQGKHERTIYLPAGASWYDFWTGQHYEGGQEITVAAPWDRTPLMVREGAVIPLNVADAHFNDTKDKRGFAIFPPRATGKVVVERFEDDGWSEKYRDGDYGTWKLTVEADEEQVIIDVAASGKKAPEAKELEIELPAQDERKIVVTGATVVDDDRFASPRRLKLAL